MSFHFKFGNRKNPHASLSEEAWALQPHMKQVRAAGIVEVKTAGQNCGEADAMWTREPGIPMGVNTADCVPILLYRKDGKAIAAIHAGWQGTVLHIVRIFFGALPADLNRPSEWVAKLGPSIRACCYEFGEDLVERFRGEFPNLSAQEITPTLRHLDLIAILSHELAALGVPIESIDPQCTYCTREANGDLRFFSYRQGDRNSRQYSIILK